jgi:hypothetical protein
MRGGVVDFYAYNAQELKRIGNQPRIVRERSDGDWVPVLAFWQGWELPLLGVTLDVDGALNVVLFYDQLQDPKWLQHTAMHEALHAIGLADVDVENNVMSSHMCYEQRDQTRRCNAAIRMGEADRQEFCAARGCETRDLP